MLAQELEEIKAVAQGLVANPTQLRYVDRMRIESSIFRVLQRLIGLHSGYRIRGFSPKSILEVNQVLSDFDGEDWFMLVKKGFELAAATQRLSIGNPYELGNLDDAFVGQGELVRRLALGLERFADRYMRVMAPFG